jgi:hypothetical protein
MQASARGKFYDLHLDTPSWSRGWPLDCPSETQPNPEYRVGRHLQFISNAFQPNLIRSFDVVLDLDI